MNHSVKRRRQALHQTHRNYYLNISVQAEIYQIGESNRKKIDSVARIESNRIETFLPELECSSIYRCPIRRYSSASDDFTFRHYADGHRTLCTELICDLYVQFTLSASTRATWRGRCELDIRRVASAYLQRLPLSFQPRAHDATRVGS